MARKRIQPHAIILAGPNGAGKSTAAPRLLAETLGVTEFVNADVIASGLSAFAPENAAMEAGAVMHQRLCELAKSRRNFAFETTLAGRTLAPWIKELRGNGYAVHLHFLWLSDPELAIARVKQRVAQGGHDVPEETIRRRYFRGIANLIHLYIPLVSTWMCYDNSATTGYRIVARGRVGQIVVEDLDLWLRIAGS